MAQKKAIQLDSIVFDHSLFIEEEDAPNNIQSEVNLTESGVHVVWQSEIKTPYITLISKNHGWLKQSTKDAIMALYNQYESTFVVTYDDLSTDTVRFAHERGLSFTPIFEGSEHYTTQINLAKVIV